MTLLLDFKQTDQEVFDFYTRSAATPIPNVPKFDSRRVVDGQRSMTFLKPLPPTSAGKTFELRSKVLGVYDKGKAGTVIETETIIAEREGDIYTRAVGSSFFVGQGNWGGPKGEDWNRSAFRTNFDEGIRPRYSELSSTRREKTRRGAYSADNQRDSPLVQVMIALSLLEND